MNKVFNANVSGSDDFYTPQWIVDVLLKYLPDRFVDIYEPACGEGHIVKRLTDLWLSCSGTDIKTGHDFLMSDSILIRNLYDCIITNPPFSIKDKFIERCIEIGLPWALLLPVSSIQGKKRNELFNKVHDLSIIIPNKRVAFIGSKQQPNFASAWFCSGFGLGKQLIFTN